MKLYKLKEEARKYLQEEHWKRHWNVEQSLDRWLNTTCMNEEALEEVQTRIEVRIHVDKPRILNKVTEGMFVWTEQERKDIETFLNEFGSMKVLFELAFDYYTDSKDDLKGFEEWLKDNNIK